MITKFYIIEFVHPSWLALSCFILSVAFLTYIIIQICMYVYWLTTQCVLIHCLLFFFPRNDSLNLLDLVALMTSMVIVSICGCCLKSVKLLNFKNDGSCFRYYILLLWLRYKDHLLPLWIPYTWWYPLCYQS